MKRVGPYKKLAEIYDRLMDHVDYNQWSAYVLQLITKYHPNPQTIIDLSCGTGNFLFLLYEYFKFFLAGDLSEEMIYQSWKKNKSEQIYLFVNDIQEIAVKDCQFDCALLLYDTLNYIIDEKLLKQSITEIRRILNPSGLFIFDIVTDKHCREHYADNYESEYWDRVGYSRHSYYDEKKGYQYTEFRIVKNGHTYFEEHKQKIYSVDFLKGALINSGFDLLESDSQFPNDELINGRSGRIHFVCRKM